jgi:uroporphyrinogen decarboxylase
MLTKKQVQSCLAGETMDMAPAFFHWMDKEFIQSNKNFVNEMHKLYEDDFIMKEPLYIRKAKELVMEHGEFQDVWGSRFAAVPGGVGAHPTLPIILTLHDRDEYKENGMPELESGIFVKDTKEIVLNNPDRYVLSNIWRTFYERMYMLIGMETLWIKMAYKDELFLAMLKDLKNYTIECIKLAKAAGVDGVYLADDWGTQNSLQISPDMWKQYFKPAYAEMIETAHSLNMDVWMHSCGCIDRLIPEFIDIHLDVIGNLQTAAVDLKAYSENYLGQITFFGGLDVQSNLTLGTPQSIESEVKEITRLFHPSKGQYIFAPSNTIMPETPPENVRALFKAMDMYRRTV